MNDLTFIFDQFNKYLLNKSVNKKRTDPKLLNSSIWGKKTIIESM